MRHAKHVATALLAGLIALQISFAASAAPTLEEMAKRPLKTIERQAKAGDTASQVELARRYGSGDGGVKKDQLKAAHLLADPVEKGDPMAQYYLGLAYATGSGVETDDAKAVLLFDAAAKQGEKNSQYMLAFAIINGMGGILPNWTAAIPWLEKAAEQDVVKAQFLLANAYVAGSGVTADPERAASWYRRGFAISKDPTFTDRLRLLIRNGAIKWQPGDPEDAISPTKDTP